MRSISFRSVDIKEKIKELRKPLLEMANSEREYNHHLFEENTKTIKFLEWIFNKTNNKNYVQKFHEIYEQNAYISSDVEVLNSKLENIDKRISNHEVEILKIKKELQKEETEKRKTLLEISKIKEDNKNFLCGVSKIKALKNNISKHVTIFLAVDLWKSNVSQIMKYYHSAPTEGKKAIEFTMKYFLGMESDKIKEIKSSKNIV